MYTIFLTARLKKKDLRIAKSMDWSLLQIQETRNKIQEVYKNLVPTFGRHFLIKLIIWKSNKHRDKMLINNARDWSLLLLNFCNSTFIVDSYKHATIKLILAFTDDWMSWTFPLKIIIRHCNNMVKVNNQHAG